ncbi:hypothetical protein CLOP_g10443 [Closterium sp. NIES-67]|nr:hypothetical protein CLOP_g10443 [Closterium sp. NIES-67]
MCLPLRGNSAEISWTPTLVKISRELSVDSKGGLKFACGTGVSADKGKDYDEVFAPVGKGTTLRVLLAIAALLGWKIRQMDIVTAFLNGIIMEEVYMKQPEGLDDGSGRVCRLKKAIYGLKQAPHS